MTLHLVSDHPEYAAYHLLFEGTKEIVGPEEARALFRAELASAGNRSSLGALQQALGRRYGQPSGQGLSQRVGRATFRQALRSWSVSGAATHANLRLLPFNQRVYHGLTLGADLFSRATHEAVLVSDEGDHWLWQVQASSSSLSSPACSLVIGLLQGFMTWAGNGHAYRVHETACACAGDPACRFRIDKTSLD